MNLFRSLSVSLVLGALLAACGQQATPLATHSADVTTEAALRQEGNLTAASGLCNVVPNESGWCNRDAPLSQYRFFVKCYDNGVANRFVYVYGVWRNNGGTYRSHATCAAGDWYQTYGFEWR